MLNDITITPATEADLPSIKPLLLELMDAMDNTEGFDVEKSFENCRVLIRDPAHYMLLAKDKDKVAGLVNFTTRKTIMHPGPSGLIDELIVSRSHRGLGIGKQLILAAIQKCRELDCCEVEVSTEKSNSKAREFYQRCGFEEDAVLLEIDLK
ncbi:MAG TPA: GNAT family N-acetyltransferase [candidate division Zixibacteria bacterium]|jgi:ribosomal protein S18 acetylase RimI-like enzyme